jgi:Pyruvate/2-oxoacid:ferredoxin oxidoreductase delta subunit
MGKVKRQVIRIDEELCNGCGNCVPSCAEGAIQIINGKAKMVSDKYCDGLGACLGECPMGAISFEEREAEEFDEEAVAQHLKAVGRTAAPQAYSKPVEAPVGQGCSVSGGCPSARMLDFRSDDTLEEADTDQPKLKSELRQWPVKLYLVSPSAPYFKDADLLIAADCAPFSYASLHPDFLKGKALVIGCPKFDDTQAYVDKLTAILSENNIKSITVLHMEVPCCFGLMGVARQALANSGKNIPLETKVVTLRGDVEDPKGAASLF